jgi:hypothetical protein
MNRADVFSLSEVPPVAQCRDPEISSGECKPTPALSAEPYIQNAEEFVPFPFLGF